MEIITHSLHQALLFLPLSLGVFISYRVTKLTDLAVEGSFVMGAALYANTLIGTGSVALSLLAGMLSGMAVGMGAALIQSKERMNSLMAGIVALFMLQSLNIFVMGKPNINLLNTDNTLGSFSTALRLSCIIFLILFVMMRSHIGLKLRALGNNPALFQSLFQRRDLYKGLCLMISNSLAALSGMMTASSNGFADVQMGQGTALIGIGTVLLGQALLHRPHFYSFYYLGLTAVGTFIYFALIQLFLIFDISTFLLRLLLGVFLALILARRHHVIR